MPCEMPVTRLDCLALPCLNQLLTKPEENSSSGEKCVDWDSQCHLQDRDVNFKTHRNGVPRSSRKLWKYLEVLLTASCIQAVWESAIMLNSRIFSTNWNKIAVSKLPVDRNHRFSIKLTLKKGLLSRETFFLKPISWNPKCFHLDKLKGWCGNLLVFCSLRSPFISLVCVSHQELGNTTSVMQQLSSGKREISCIMGHKGKWEYETWNSISQSTTQQHFLMEIFWVLVEIFWYLSFSQNIEIFPLKNWDENYFVFSLKFCPGKIKHFPTSSTENHKNHSLFFFPFTI